MPAFRLPDIGEGLTEAEIVQWFVAVGDDVAVDQVIVEIETAKTVVEIQSPFSGTVSFLAADPGATVEVGEILFIIGEPDTTRVPPSGGTGEDVVEPGGRASPRAPSSRSGTDERSESGGTGEDVVEPGRRAIHSRPPFRGDGRDVVESGGPASPRAPSPSEEPTSAVRRPTSVKAMAIVRKLAADRGIDLSLINGTGPGGAITRADVEGCTPSPSGPDGELVALTPTRRAVAEHMAASWREIPHVTVQAEFRAENLLAARRSGDTTLSIEAVVAARVLPLLDEFPEFNARFTDRGILLRAARHLGFAIDTEAGLIVVVVKNASDMAIGEIDTEFSRLARAAKERTIKAEEVTGQTFTISNIGALGGGHGTPIIPLGTTAILSIGRAKESAVVVEGSLGIGVVAPLDLSYDHRVIDGGLGQRFAGAVVEALEVDDT